MDEYREERNLPQDEEQPEEVPVRRRRKKKNFFQRLISMPPRFLLALAAVLIVLLVVILATAKGCSAKPADGMSAQAFSTKAELKLPVSAELNNGDFLSYGGYQFETSKKPAAMVKLAAKGDEQLTVDSYTNAYGTCYVFTKPGTAGTDSWCLYQKDPTNTRNWYIFMGMHREVMLEDGDLDILLPLHLISDSALRDNMGARLELGRTYGCGLDKLEDGQSLVSLFQKFYEDSGKYVAISNGAGFSVYPKSDSSRELIFSFDDAVSPSKFMITVPVVEVPEPSSIAEIQYLGAEGTAPVSLPEKDALNLTNMLINQTFAESAPTESAVEYMISTGDELYSVYTGWEDETWSVRLEKGTESVTLNAKDSCLVMAVIGANGVGGAPERDTSNWAGDVDTSFVPSALQMVTTADLRVRTAPSTNANTLTSLTEGSSVAVVARNADSWCEVWYNDQLAYMSGSYLKTVD